MDMRIIYYAIAIAGGIILTVSGAYFAGGHYMKNKNAESNKEQEVFTPSSWITHFNDHQSKLDPLETEFDSLHKVWWEFYNELNFPKMKETNDRMKELANQMRLLNEKYKATQHE